VLHLPGHSRDGMALHDLDRNLMFVRDFITPAAPTCSPPAPDLGEYLRPASAVLEILNEDTLIMSAHTGRPAVTTVPVMRRGDVEVLLSRLRLVRDGAVRGRGIFPRCYPVTAAMTIYAGSSWRR
jgi:glyoxylase-like metal-dependent hydrolase (beta-lactamase superfamily II)